MRRIQAVILSMAVLVVGFCFPVSAARDEIVMWGIQTRWVGLLDEKARYNYVELEQSAMVVEVRGNAKSYCIWSEGEEIVCGGAKESIVGETLGRGVYHVFPALMKGYPKSKVYIYLDYVDD